MNTKWNRKLGKTKKELGIVTPKNLTVRVSKAKEKIRYKLSRKGKK